MSIHHKNTDPSLENVLERVNAIKKIADELHAGLYLGGHFVEGGLSQMKHYQIQLQKELIALFSEYPEITKELVKRKVHTKNLTVLQCNADQAKKVSDQLFTIEKIIKINREKWNYSILSLDNMVKKFEHTHADYLPLAEEIIVMMKGKNSPGEIQKNIAFLQKISSLIEEKKKSETISVSRDAVELDIIKKMVADKILSVLLAEDDDTINNQKRIKDIHVIFTKSQNIIDMRYGCALPGAYQKNDEEKIPIRKEPEASIIGEVLKNIADGSISSLPEANTYYFQKKGTYTPGMKTKVMEKLFHNDERLRFLAGYIKSSSLGISIPIIGKHEALIDLDMLERVFQRIWADGYTKDKNLSYIQHFKKLSHQNTADVSEGQDRKTIDDTDPQQAECRIQKAIQREIGMEGFLLTEDNYQQKLLGVDFTKMEKNSINNIKQLVEKARKYQCYANLEMWRYEGFLISLQQKMLLEIGMRNMRQNMIKERNAMMITLKKFIGKGMKTIKIENLSEYIDACKNATRNMNINTSNVAAKKNHHILDEIDFLVHLPSGEFDVHNYKDKDSFGYEYADLIDQIKKIFEGDLGISTEKEMIIIPQTVPQEIPVLLNEEDLKKISDIRTHYQEIKKIMYDLEKKIPAETGKYIDQEKTIYGARREVIKQNKLKDPESEMINIVNRGPTFLQAAIKKYTNFITCISDLEKQVAIIKENFLQRDKDFFKDNNKFGSFLEKKKIVIDERLTTSKERKKKITDAYAYACGIANK